MYLDIDHATQYVLRIPIALLSVTFFFILWRVCEFMEEKCNLGYTQHRKVKARGSPLYCKARRVDVYACEAQPILKMIYFAILLNICVYMTLVSGTAILF